MRTITHQVVYTKTVDYDYDVPDDAIAVIHYESTYEGSDFCGALKETDNNLHKWDGSRWVWTIYRDMDHLIKVYGKRCIVWKRSDEDQ